MAPAAHPAAEPGVRLQVGPGGAGLRHGRAGSLFSLNEADDLVYFGRGTDRAKKVLITRGMWNGAATGAGAYQLIVPGKKEVGGYHVQRIS